MKLRKTVDDILSLNIVWDYLFRKDARFGMGVISAAVGAAIGVFSWMMFDPRFRYYRKQPLDGGSILEGAKERLVTGSVAGAFALLCIALGIASIYRGWKAGRRTGVN